QDEQYFGKLGQHVEQNQIDHIGAYPKTYAANGELSPNEGRECGAEFIETFPAVFPVALKAAQDHSIERPGELRTERTHGRDRVQPVDFLEPVDHVQDFGDCFFNGEWATLLHQVLESGTRHQFHGDIRLSRLFIHREYKHTAWMSNGAR